MSSGLVHLPQLAIQPQQPTDPLEKYGQLLSIQRLGAQQQLQQSQIQNAQLETQERQLQVAQAQRDAQDQQTMRSQAPNFVQKDESGKVTGYDSDGYLNSLLANGVSPTKVSAIKMQQAQTSKALADSGEANLKLLDAKLDNAYNILEGVRSLAKDPKFGPATVQGAYQDALPKLQQLGYDTSKYPQQFAQVGDEGLQRFEADLGAHKQIINDAKNQSEIGKNTSAQAASDVETKLKQAQLDASKSGGLAPGVPIENQAYPVWKAQQEAAGKPSDLDTYQKHVKTMVPAFGFALQANGVPGSGAPSVNPDGTAKTPEQLYQSFGAKAGIVKGIVEGRQTLPSGAAQRSPYWQDVTNKVYQVDPGWSEERAQIRKAFTTGKDGTNIGNLNTAAVHLDALGEAAKAMDNGTFKPGNDIYNKIRTMFGSSAPTTAEAIKTAASGEMASALKGNATDPEIAQLKKNYDVAGDSPAQIAGVIDSHLGIIGQKLQTYKERYEQQNPGDTVYSPVLPSAQAVFEKHRPGQQASGKDFGAAPAGKTDGATGKLPDGTKVVVKGGRLVAQ